MKLKSFFLALFLVLFSSALFAQVGSTGAPQADFETRLVCWDNAGTKTTLVQLTLYVVGENFSPKVVSYHNLQGLPVSLGLNPTFTFGSCDEGVNAVPSDYEIQNLCDDGTPFFRILEISANGDVTVLADYDANLVAYEVTGGTTFGPCSLAGATNLTSGQATTALTIPAGQNSVFVCNNAITNQNITIDTDTYVLKPAECFSFTAIRDPTNNIYRRSPVISWTGTVSISYSYF